MKKWDWKGWTRIRQPATDYGGSLLSLAHRMGEGGRRPGEGMSLVREGGQQNKLFLRLSIAQSGPGRGGARLSQTPNPLVPRGARESKRQN
jgi:hypothetical protein